MRMLLIGKQGQVGYQLSRCLPRLGELVALGREELDLRDADAIRTWIRSVKPDLVINAAAYTAVDKAEQAPGEAMLVNGDAPGIIAQEAHAIDAALIHYSTDYVFDGTGCSPYMEEEPPRPLNEYGRSKLKGEQGVAAAGGMYLVLRTSWVYGLRGRNFLLTMLRLAAERDALRVVDDQFGTPTWAGTIAEMTARIVEQAKAAPDWRQWWQEQGGLYHLSAQGQTSWFGFAHAILARAAPDKLEHLAPIATPDYPTPAPRPSYSVLSTRKLERRLGLVPPPWEQALGQCLAQQTGNPSA